MMRFTIATVMALSVAGVKINEDEAQKCASIEGPKIDENDMRNDAKRIFDAIDTDDDGKM